MNGFGDDGLRWAEFLPLAMAVCFGVMPALAPVEPGADPAEPVLHGDVGVRASHAAWGCCSARPSWRDLAIMAAIGALGLVFLWALDHACASVDVSTLAPFLYLEPLWLVVLRLRLLGERVPSIGSWPVRW